MSLLRVVRVAIQDEFEKGLEAPRDPVEPDGEMEYFLAEEGGKPLGTGLLCITRSLVRFERIHVSEEAKREEIALSLIQTMEQFASESYPHHLQLTYAEEETKAFYERRGWLFLADENSSSLMIHPPKDSSHLLCFHDTQTPASIRNYFKA